MIRRRLGILFVDCLSLVGAIVFAQLLRDNLIFNTTRIEGLHAYVVATLAMALVAIPVSGIDRMVWRLRTFYDYVRVAWTVLAIVVGASVITFAFNRLDGVSRSIPILQLILSITALVGVRTLVPGYIRARRSRRNLQRSRDIGLAVHSDSRSVLLVGLNRLSDLYAEAVAELAPNDAHIAGLVGPSHRHVGKLLGAHKVLGTPEELEEIVRDLAVHGVFIDNIIVMVAPNRLSHIAREALLRLERGSNVKVEYLVEKIGLRTEASNRFRARSLCRTCPTMQ